MGKFLKDLIVLLFCYVILEFCMYMKDYNEVMFISNYIAYDIENNNLQSTCNDKYCISIENDENTLSYKIEYNRKSFFIFEQLKTIIYQASIDKM